MKEMKQDKIKALLQKYYDGETTLAEEKLLKEYLSRENSSPEFKQALHWFSELQQEKNVVPNPYFDIRLEKMKFPVGNKLKFRFLFAIPFRIAAIVILTLGLGFVVYFTLGNKQSQWIEAATASKEIKEVALPDGSKVWLNGASTLRYGRKFQSAARREVWLEGEAYFEVDHNPQRPFTIHIQGAITQVLGTSFNVRGYPTESTIEVGVLSGKVAFSAQESKLPEKITLQPGNGVVFDKENTSIRKTEKNDANLLAWKTHRLVFEDAPLQEVIAALEKYFGINIKLANTGLAYCRFKGTFKEAKLEEILTVMQVSMNISTLQKGNQYIISGKGCQ